jgi:hypothetical protein
MQLYYERRGHQSPAPCKISNSYGKEKIMFYEDICVTEESIQEQEEYAYIPSAVESGLEKEQPAELPEIGVMAGVAAITGVVGGRTLGVAGAGGYWRWCRSRRGDGGLCRQFIN